MAMARWPNATARSYSPRPRNSRPDRPDLSQACLIVQPFGESLGLVQAVTNAPELSQGIERVSKREAEIDSLLMRVATLRELGQDMQGLLIIRHGFVGRARRGLAPGLPEVGYGFVPDLALQGMMGQPFDLVGQTVGREPLDDLNELGVQACRRSCTRLL